MSSAVVVGGGLAGGSAAVRLARAGLRVDLFERERGAHDKVCGEFLSIEAQHDLAGVGLDADALGAVAIDRVRLVAGARAVEAALPFVARSLSRAVLDEALLDAAARAGAAVHPGVRVTGLQDGAARTALGEARAAHVLLATGKHDLRGHARPRPDAPLVGTKMHWRLTAAQARALAGTVEVVAYRGGYAGLQLVAPRTANLCALVRQDRFRALGGDWPGLLAALMAEPHLARRLADAEPLLARPPSVAGLPYGWISDPQDSAADGVLRLGDQGAMTAPLTGDGMAIALRSAALAAAVVQGGGGAPAYARALAATVRPQIRRAMVLHRLAGQRPLMGALVALLGLRPGLLGALASATRLPQPASGGFGWNAPPRLAVEAAKGESDGQD